MAGNNITNCRSYDLEELDDCSADEIMGNSLRASLSTNLYGNSLKFQVEVLNSPVTLQNSVVTRVRMGVSQKSLISDENAKSNFVRRETIKFYGRIRHSKQRPSPHQFVPHPSQKKYVTENLVLQKMVRGLHVEFYSKENWQGVRPKEGDVVEVSLRPGDYSFDLQQAYFDVITVMAEGMRDLTNASGAFKNGEPLSLDQIAYREGKHQIQIPSESDLEGHQVPGAVRPSATGVTSPYGMRWHKIDKKYKHHNGIDFGGGKRTIASKPTAEGGINANMKTVMTDPKYKEPCVAILPGEIVSVATTGIGGFGGWVVIKLYAHDYKSSPTGDKRVRDASGKIRTLYQICGHIESITDKIKRGAVVARGQTVAYIGGQGKSTGPHLHFEVREKSWSSGNHVDPMEIFGWTFSDIPGSEMEPSTPQDDDANAGEEQK